MQTTKHYINFNEGGRFVTFIWTNRMIRLYLFGFVWKHFRETFTYHEVRTLLCAFCANNIPDTWHSELGIFHYTSLPEGKYRCTAESWRKSKTVHAVAFH